MKGGRQKQGWQARKGIVTSSPPTRSTHENRYRCSSTPAIQGQNIINHVNETRMNSRNFQPSSPACQRFNSIHAFFPPPTHVPFSFSNLIYFFHLSLCSTTSLQYNTLLYPNPHPLPRQSPTTSITKSLIAPGTGSRTTLSTVPFLPSKTKRSGRRDKRGIP